MDLRRLQVTGGGTFSVSLPISWAKRNHLTRGSFMVVTERSDSSITIDPKYSSSVELISVAVPFSASLEREIIGKYLLGYDIISVNSEERLSSNDISITESVVKKHSLVHKSLYDFEETTVLQDIKYFLTISNITSALKRICDCGKDVADLVVIQ